MNPATAFAQVLVDELVRGGVEHAVLAPGSRSAPLALAFTMAERAGRLRLHVRTDERSAGFLALGLAKGSGCPVPVVTTSGTAAAHLHAAVLEASYSGVPLIALTADRPPELRGTGANQTIDQLALFGVAVRYFAEIEVPERRPGSNGVWRSQVCEALGSACGTASGRAGAVHLNLPLRDPLLPHMSSASDRAGDEPWPDSLEGRADGGPWTEAESPARDDAGGPSTAGVGGSGYTWLVLGDTTAEISAIAIAAAGRHGWPILAEPTGNAGAAALPGYLGLLESDAFMARHRPRRVITVGRLTLSRAIRRLLARPDVHVTEYAFGPQWINRGRPIDELRRVVAAEPEGHGADPGTPLVDVLAAAGDLMSDYQDRIVDEAYMGGARVARDLVCHLPDGARLFIGSSTPIRDVDRYAHPRDGVEMSANRGVAGIDGSISTALGLALSSRGRPTYALIGDLAFLHDMGGLVLPASEARPDLMLVVVDNRGGGIFAQLEPGRPEYELDYDRAFGTPHELDLVLVARSLGWEAGEVTDADQLRDALALGGPRVVVIRTDQRADAEILRRVRDFPAGLFPAL